MAACALAPDENGPLLMDALESAGTGATVGLRDDEAVDRACLDTVLVRSAWDYPLRRTGFLARVRRRRTTNPADVVAWNTDKRYPDDLAGAGVPTVPTVPTVFVEPGGSLPATPAGPLLAGSEARTPVAVADVPATVRAVEPTAAQLSLAERTPPRAAGTGWATRVDVIPGPEGPVLLELEATHCFLSFAVSSALARMVDHVLRPPVPAPR